MQSKTIITIAAIVSLACVDAEAERDADLRSIEEMTCDHHVDGLHVDFAVEGGFTLTDGAGTPIGGGTLICVDSGPVTCEDGITIGDVPCEAATRSGELKYTPQGQAANDFACSCTDQNGVGFTQWCSDPPHYRCEDCCDDATGVGSGPPIKIRPPDPSPN